MVSILFLAADPSDGSRLRLGVEAREIEDKLKIARFRRKFKFHQRPAVRPVDISQAMLDVKPQIVHFSGHGTEHGELCFENGDGRAHPVRPEALAKLFAVFAEQVNCVILNACYTAQQATAIAQYVPFVIGMSKATGDAGALAFSTGFYQALGAGMSIEESYHLGCANLELDAIVPSQCTPILVKKNEEVLLATGGSQAKEFSLANSRLGTEVGTKASVTTLSRASGMNEPLDQQLKPFGEVDCEAEVALLKEQYSSYYFTETPFSRIALSPDRYLIIGRRGAGKTALAEYFKFQDILRNAIAIDVDEPELFHSVTAQIATVTDPRELAIPRLAKVWDFVIWSIIFWRLREHDPRIAQASSLCGNVERPASFFGTFKNLLARMMGPKENSLGGEALLESRILEMGREGVLAVARKQPVIVAIDTLENIDVNDLAMMSAVGSLVECASAFNRQYCYRGLHLKVFLMAEVFPHLKEEVILNPLKSVRNEVYMHWRPKDLLRLIGWRFYQYLRIHGMLPLAAQNINWRDHQDVLEKLWKPAFSTELTNGLGLVERTFPYVLRHTQMRPRQLIVLCDRIARRAIEGGRFPNFAPEDLIEGILEGEMDLADEVLNSYSTVYPKVARILDALSGIPMVFEGRELDKRAYLTASEWPTGRYSPANFRQLVSELGIVGRVRRRDPITGIVSADFEFSSRGRLGLLTTDECAIHPMFYKRLKVMVNQRLRVYPFPDHPEFNELEYL